MAIRWSLARLGRPCPATVPGNSRLAAAAELVRDARTGLRAGDALHLAVAREVGAAQIATLDSTLEANAESQGIRPVAFAGP